MKPLTLIDKAFLLKKTLLFQSLDLDLLLTISDKMETVTFNSGEGIFPLRQDAHRMYVIVEGSVLIKDAKGTIQEELSSGEFFGDEAIFNEKPRGYEALAKTEVQLLALSRSHLLSIISECPSVAISLLEAYATHVEFRTR